MRVELDIFSGRPNPSWELTPAESGEFWRKFAALPEERSVRSLRQNLGYRGVIVSPREAGEGGWEQVIISGGLAQRENSQGIQTFADKERALERWLIHTGKAYIEPELYDEVANF
jgi:hypothetical protein